MATLIAKCKGGASALVLFSMLVIPYSVAAQRGTAEDGQKLFAQNCVTCHGADGSANSAIGKSVGAKDLRSPAAQKLTDAEIATQINQGKGNMPPFGGSLNRADVTNLVAYVRELGKKQVTTKRP